MTTAIRCELCPTRDGAKPLATCRCSLWHQSLLVDEDGFMVTFNDTTKPPVTYNLCEDCRRDAAEHGDVVPGSEGKVL